MIKENQKKETKLLEHRFIELSRIAFEREIVTYSDFLNLNDQNILHTLPKNKLYSRYVLFGGYDMAERQMAAFIPEALSLRYGVSDITPKEIDYPFCAVKIEPKNKRFSEDLTHRDFLGSILNLGIDRSKTGDILVTEDSALLFIRLIDQIFCFRIRKIKSCCYTTNTVFHICTNEDADNIWIGF